MRWRATLFLLLMLFLCIGYALSDALFFRELASRNGIRTPEQAFRYLVAKTSPPLPGQKAIYGASARYLLTSQRRLYCDEGALVMATLLRGSNYPTRLVDLIGDDGVSHHTVLEVREEGRWYIYDTLRRLSHRNPAELQQYSPYHIAAAVRRPSWSLYRSIYFYNAFAKRAIFAARGLPL